MAIPANWVKMDPVDVQITDLTESLIKRDRKETRAFYNPTCSCASRSRVHCTAQQCSPSAILAQRPFASLSATADSSCVTACVIHCLSSVMTNEYECVCACGNAEHSRRGTQSDPGVSARTQVHIRRHAHLVRTVCDHCTRLD